MPHQTMGHLPTFLMARNVTPPGPTFPTASTTGLLGIGVNPASLTNQGTITYSTNGQTITGMNFTGEVIVTGNNVTIAGCRFNWGDAAGNGVDIALEVRGSNCVIRDNTFYPPVVGGVQQAFYVACLVSAGDNCQILRNDIGFAENTVTLDSTSSVTNVTIKDNYMHDLVGNDNDCVEVYNNITTVLIQHNTLVQAPAPGQASSGGAESSVNIAPYSGAASVSGVTVQDNWMDGGIVHTLVDVQSTGTIQFTKFLRNYFGGHTNPGVVGVYNVFQNSDSRAITHDDTAQASAPDSVQWPNTGPNVNYWWSCGGLSPDHSGQIISVG